MDSANVVVMQINLILVVQLNAICPLLFSLRLSCKRWIQPMLLPRASDLEEEPTIDWNKVLDNMQGTSLNVKFK